MDSSSARDVPPVSKKWSGKEALHFRIGLQQVIPEIQETTKLLKAHDENALTSQSLIIVWRIFYCLINWTLHFEGSAQPIEEIVQEMGAQQILDRFNEALKAYCNFTHYGLPELKELSIERVTEEGFFFDSEEYLALVCSLYLGTKRLDQLNERLQDPSFNWEQDKLENPENEEHYIPREVFETIYQTYGNVLCCFEYLETSAEKDFSVDSVYKTNVMIEKFETALEKTLSAVQDPEALPVELEDLENIVLPRLEKTTILEDGKEFQVFCFSRKESAFRLDAERQIIQVANIKSQVDLLTWSNFWKNNKVDPMLRKEICLRIFSELRDEWMSLCKSFPSGLLKEEVRIYHPKMIEAIEELHKDPIFSDEIGSKGHSVFLRFLEQYSNFEVQDAESRSAEYSSFRP